MNISKKFTIVDSKNNDTYPKINSNGYSDICITIDNQDRVEITVLKNTENGYVWYYLINNNCNQKNVGKPLSNQKIITWAKIPTLSELNERSDLSLDHLYGWSSLNEKEIGKKFKENNKYIVMDKNGYLIPVTGDYDSFDIGMNFFSINGLYKLDNKNIAYIANIPKLHVEKVYSIVKD